MSRLKLKMSLDDEVIIRAKGDKVSDFDNILTGLKKKLDGRRR